LEQKERWEPLGKRLKILVNSEFGFGTDSLLLADFAAPKNGENSADLGCGCGAIALLWLYRAKPGKTLAVEIQRSAVDLMRKSVKENGYEDRVLVINEDIRNYKHILPHQGLDLIACNPPYFSEGLKSSNPQRNTIRHSDSLELDDLAKAAKFSLKYGGRLCICMPAFRLAYAINTLHVRGLEAKRLRLVQSTNDKPPYLFLLECRSGGKPGVEIMPTLVLNDGGLPSKEIIRIYGDYMDKED